MASALLGFCFGGGLAFNVAAVDDVDVLVSYYGSALRRLLSWPATCKRPACTTSGWPTRSSRWRPSREIRAAVTEHGAQFEIYPGANHAFDNPSPAFHHPEASAAAWANHHTFPESAPADLTNGRLVRSSQEG